MEAPSFSVHVYWHNNNSPITQLATVLNEATFTAENGGRWELEKAEKAEDLLLYSLWRNRQQRYHQERWHFWTEVCVFLCGK